MSDLSKSRLATAVFPPDQLRDLAREKTSARILVDRAGGGYLTRTQLELRADHAAARDAVQTELSLADFDPEFIARFGLKLVQTAATSKAEFLLRPELGRALSEDAKRQLCVRDQSPPLPNPLPRGGGEGTKQNPRLQIVLGDGLSATAVQTQIPGILPLLIDAARQANWSVLQPFVIRYCRVGVMNDLGDLLRPDVVVLLIGERPGLATAESLSAYMAFRPKTGDTDAQRNLISNIHARGVSHEAAVVRILDLAQQMIESQTSGVEIKERLPAKATELTTKLT